MSLCRIQTSIRGWLGSRSQKSKERGGGDRKRGRGQVGERMGTVTSAVPWEEAHGQRRLKIQETRRHQW